MVDAITILIVIVLLIFALKNSLKHFRGEGGCCGGGSGASKVKMREKRLDIKSSPLDKLKRVTHNHYD